MRDPRLLGHGADQRGDRGDRQHRDRDQRQPKAKLDEPEAVAAVENRVTRGIVMLRLGVHATSASCGGAIRPHPLVADTYPFVPRRP